jgi:transposase
MQLRTILNSIDKHKSFVYGEARWSSNANKSEIEIPVAPRKNAKGICSRCSKPASGYDRLTPRRFEYVPLWSIPVFLVYAMRRVDCKTCGVVTERVPWSDGKSRQTYSYRLFLATWAKRLSWHEVAQIFGTSWDSVYRAIFWVVSYGIVHREFGTITAIGIDEIQYRRGHKYLTGVTG